MEIGDWVLAFGSPFGLDRTVTQGIISAKSRGLKNLPSRQEFLQTDAAINPGNSGGPLVNLAGEVIGINTAIETRSGGYDGVGFAVPVSLAKWVGDQLANDGKVRRAYLGVKPDDVDSDIAKALELPTSKGVIVSEVTKGSPAEQAGVKVQDVILKLNNRAVSNRQQLITVAERLSIGESYPLVVLRDGKEIELTVVAAEFPEQVAQASQQVDALGAEVQELTPELARELELDTDTGVVVTNVQRGSLAARIGLRPGVVIARIGKMEVNTLEDFEKGLQAAREKRQLVLLVKTSNGTQLISVPLSKRGIRASPPEEGKGRTDDPIHVGAKT
jgi:serine protease Do